MPYANIEERKAYNKAYREAHKAEKKEYNKAYNESHNVEAKAYNQTPNRKKSNSISDWKRSGLIHNNYEQLYDLYLQSTHCDVCKSEYKDSSDRCMDHNHETNLFRQFLCQSCNRNDAWINKV